MHDRGWEVSGESFSSSDIFVHELAVELWTDCVVDEVLLLSRNRQWTFSPHIVQLKYMYMQSLLRLLIDSIAPETFWAGLEMRAYLTALVHVCSELFVITSIFARWLLAASTLLTNSSFIYLRAKLVWGTLFLCSPFAQFLNTTSSSHLRGEREHHHPKALSCTDLSSDLLLILKLLFCCWLRRGLPLSRFSVRILSSSSLRSRSW